MLITPIGLKTCPGLSCTYSAQFQKKIPRISNRGSVRELLLYYNSMALVQSSCDRDTSTHLLCTALRANIDCIVNNVIQLTFQGC